MKRILAAFLCAVMCVSFVPAALADDLRNLSSETELASKLSELGLFQGVGDSGSGAADFDLDRAPTRVEALVMLIRALGKDTEAKAYPKTHPFTDVPAWADGYVSYAYDNALTKGVSAARFGAGDTASSDEYLTFMLRALGYTEGVYNEFTWDASQALAAWCGILPVKVNWTQFLRSDAVDVTCAALFANLKGSKTTLHEHLASQGVFTEAQFAAAFPTDPFAQDKLLNDRVSEVISSQVKLGMVDDNVYATACHAIADTAESDGVLTVSALVCYQELPLPKDGVIPYWSSYGTVAPWLIELKKGTLEFISCRPAYELKAEGLALTDCFSAKTLAAKDKLQLSMIDVCNLETQLLIDSKVIAYRQPTYEETLAKAKASLTKVTQTLETPACTALLGKLGGNYENYYMVILVFKPGSAVGEGETYTLMGSSEGKMWLSEDGVTFNYSYHFVDRAICEGLPPDAYRYLPETGTCSYTIDLNTLNMGMGIQADE